MALFKKLGKAVKKAVGGGAVAAASKNMAPALGGAVTAAPKKAVPMMAGAVAAATKKMQPALGGAVAAAKPAVGAALQKKSLGKVIGRGLIGRR
jgi:hypothetical protein